MMRFLFKRLYVGCLKWILGQHVIEIPKGSALIIVKYYLFSNQGDHS